VGPLRDVVLATGVLVTAALPLNVLTFFNRMAAVGNLDWRCQSVAHMVVPHSIYVLRLG
jgi:hypothetical protein